MRPIPTRFAALIGLIPARMSFQYSSSRLRVLLRPRLAVVKHLGGVLRRDLELAVDRGPLFVAIRRAIPAPYSDAKRNRDERRCDRKRPTCTRGDIR